MSIIGKGIECLVTKSLHTQMCSYLLDEHVPKAYRAQLIYHDGTITVLMIGDEGAPARSTPDPEILQWCEQNNFTHPPQFKTLHKTP